MRGKAVVIPMATLAAVAAVVAVAYKVQESGLEPVEMRFAGDPSDGPGSAPVHDVPYERIHNSGTMLEDHLDYANHWGSSRETVRLRIEAMAAQIEDVTGEEGPIWWLRWDGHVVRVELVTAPA